MRHVTGDPACRAAVARRCGLAVLALVALAAAAAAQGAREVCTVSVLNRTAYVRPDGSWNLFNIPSNMGPVRARVNCVGGDGTRSGSSERFVITRDRMNAIPPIPFGAAAPAPARIGLLAPVTRLTSAGETVQLAVTATFADGSAADVTAGAEGTVYGTTNPGVATVSADGLVTAVASGRVLVTALHEAILAAVAIDIVTSGDADGDGIPDDLELAAGLDPDDPLDGLADLDGDGLTNREELLDFGTDLRDPDTDGDGLEDGREARETGTQPLLFDTDGDAVSDGLELIAGSDPLDPDSVELAPILAALTVAPESFTLVFNTVVGEASRQITVSAGLIDGTVIDATGARYGAAYTSSNLAVANFGSEPGRVFAGQEGLAAVTATIGAFSAQTLVRVQRFSPIALSFVALPGSPNAVALADRHAFVACGSAGLQVVDVGDPEAPLRVGSLAVPGAAFEVAVAGPVAYVAAGAGGLRVVDVTTPALPAPLGAAPTPSPALDVSVAGDVAYVVDGAGLRLFDVADPSAPVALGSLALPGRPRGVDTDGALAVVAAEAAGVLIVDVTDPAEPELVGSVATRPDGSSEASSVLLRESTAYVADGARTLGGLKVVDVSVPSTPVVVGATGDGFGLNEVAADGRFVLGADYFFANAVPIFNVELQPPLFAGALDFSRIPSFRDDNGHGIAMADGLVYVVGDRTRTTRFGLTGSGGLHIGRYLRAEPEPAEPRPPSVTITAPAPGTSVRERSFLNLAASAQDDVRVARVEFRVDGQLVGTDFAPPYIAFFRAPAGFATLEIAATAFDAAGLSAEAEPVLLEVLGDARPTVRMLAPAPGARVVEGRSLVAAAEATDDISVHRVEFMVDGVVEATSFFRPYRVDLVAPLGAASFSVAAVAYDGGGQFEVSEAVIVEVDPDEPPQVAILAPADGEEVAEGALVRVSVGAVDDYRLGAVSLLVDGIASGSDATPPFEFLVRAPLGATTLELTAAASDDFEQIGTSAPVTLSVVADPGTTVEGRVVDAAGAPLAGAEVVCAGVGGLSGGDGSFSLSPVPTVTAIACRAEAFAGSELLVGASAPVPPVIGGITDAGTLVALPRLLYLAAGDYFASLEPGRLLVRDPIAGRLLPWSPRIPESGLSGLAFDGLGALYATRLEDPGVGPDLLRAAAASGELAPMPGALGGGFGRSFLMRLDPDTGEVLGEVEILDPEGDPVVIEDLTFDPGMEKLFGVDAEPSELSAVYSIDPATAVATPLAEGFSLESAGLAIGGDGLLYLVAVEGGAEIDLARAAPADSPSPRPIAAPGGGGGGFGSLRLLVIDTADGTVVGDELIDGTPEEREVGGLVAEAGAGLILAAGRALYPLDLVGLTLGPPEEQSGVAVGTLQAVALRSLAAPQVNTTVVGLVTDDGGAPVAGVPVATLGAFATTDAAGSFNLPGAAVRSGRVRALAERLGEVGFSQAVVPVAGGASDVGTIVLGSTACLRGVLTYGGGCVSGPVTAPVRLELLEDFGDWLEVGEVVPGPDGSFCVDLRRDVVFRLREDDVLCTCGFPSECATFLDLVDPDAGGTCDDPLAACEDLGEVDLFCDLSCGE